MRKIHRDSFRYRFLFTIMQFAFRQFTRQTEVRGLNNIPVNDPVIFAPNHQSGLIDPLIVLFSRKEPVVFMARADIFKNKLLASFLRFLKIMPVFRIRDGYENLGKNEKQFNEAREVLIDSKKLCLMPEGNHGHQHRLRPLVKGLFRIAFAAEASMKDNHHVHIVPVGIDMSYFQHAGADVVLTFGKPIHVQDYMTQYRENPATALNNVREALKNSLSPLMQDIRSEENYDLIYRLSCYGTPAWLEVQAVKNAKQAPSVAGRQYDARKALSERFDALEKTESPMLTRWSQLTHRLNALPGYPTEVTAWMEYRPSSLGIMDTVLMTLLMLPGIVLNFPAWIVSRLLCLRIEDKQMHNTFAFALGFLLNPLVYVVFGLVLGISFALNGFLIAGLIPLIAFYGVLAERWRQTLRVPFSVFFFYLSGKKESVRKARADYNQLKSSLLEWIKTGC